MEADPTHRVAAAEVGSREHNFYLDVAGNFIVFSDQDLSMEPIGIDDMEPVIFRTAMLGNQDMRSMAWSSDVIWFFVVTDDGIVLLNQGNPNGVRCRKKSAMFIDWFLKSPLRHPPKRAAISARGAR